ncbi:hypothetical protein MAR_012721, partial [Mya arenaria]
GSIKHAFFWREHSCDSNPISYDGVPFIIVGKQRRECFHGPDRNRVDHTYEEKGRKLVLPSHKWNCPAFIMLRYIVRFPQYKFGSIFQPLDKVIINRIKALVAEEIRSVSEMKRHLRIFAKQNFPGVSELSNRYFPSNKDIRNHMSATLRLDNAHACSASQSDGLGDHMEELIFVHQNSDKKRLLAK